MDKENLNQSTGPNSGQSQGPNGDNGNQTPGMFPTGGTNIFHYIMIFFVITFIFNMLVSSFAGSRKVEIPYNQFISLVESGNVEGVQIGSEEILITIRSDADHEAVKAIVGNQEVGNIYYTGPLNDPGLTDRLLQYDVTISSPVVRNNAILSFVLSWIFPTLMLYFIFMLISRTMQKRMADSDGGGLGGIMGVGKSKAKMYTVEESTGVTFRDVAGQDEAKESLMEIVDYLHDPEKYRKIGAKQIGGALLVGPPGTGKTLLAKAVAGEAKVPFFSLSGSEFVEMFVGVGAKRVRDLFEQANKNAPCIIFIDEIDAIGKSRDNQMGSNDEREQTLNQLLAEMDGFDSSKGIVVLAATNRPEVLDKALLRPGRFDRRIIVEKPDLPGRESILKVHAAKVTMGPDTDLHEIALATSGATGADLANMINEAALRAVRMGRHSVMQEDLMESVELVIAGKEKKDRILNPKEKKMVAYHEVGHALATALQKDGSPVQKITIVPRTMGSLGYTMNAPEEERYLLTKGELEAQIVTLLAGRAAEEVVFGEQSTGASNDIERATKLARNMVTQYGMSERFGMVSLETAGAQYLDGRPVMNCSEATGAVIDQEVTDIIRSCHSKAIELLGQNRQKLDEISQFLIEKETITGAQFMEILKAA